METLVLFLEFANAFKELAKQGKPLKDPACRDATKAFFKAIPEKPDPANAAAFYAFMDKIFEEDAPAFDPVWKDLLSPTTLEMIF